MALAPTDEGGTRRHTELGLVLCAIELEHHLIDVVLVGDVHADDVGGDDLLDVLDGLGDVLAVVGLATVTELAGFVNTGGGTGGDGGTEETVLGGDVDLDGGVATATGMRRRREKYLSRTIRALTAWMEWLPKERVKVLAEAQTARFIIFERGSGR